MATRKCVFCQVRNSNTYEDAWPVWLSKAWHQAFPTADPPMTNTLTKGSMAAPTVLRRWQGRHRVGGFCNICNNEWMSRIEMAVKPIVIPMMLGKKVTVTPIDQKRLARWAWMKSLIFALSTPEVQITDAEFRRFKHKKTPPHLASVFVLTSLDMFGGSMYRIDPLTVTHVDGTTSESHRFSFVIGHLVLQVFKPRPPNVPIPAGTVRSSGVEGIQRIWKPQEAFTWPLDKPLERKAVAQLLDFFHQKKAG